MRYLAGRLARSPAANVLFGTLLLLPACRSCRKLEAATTPPPDAVLQDKVREKLPHDHDAIKKLCGVSAETLDATEIEVQGKPLLGIAHVKVTGRPKGAGGAQLFEPDLDAGAAHEFDAAHDARAGLDGGKGAKPASRDAGSPDAGKGLVVGVQPGKALVCAGVLLISFDTMVEDDGVTVKGWKIRSLEVQEVSTPGVHFERPSRGHHHRHHG